jgi:hypothetical protein
MKKLIILSLLCSFISVKSSVDLLALAKEKATLLDELENFNVALGPNQKYLSDYLTSITKRAYSGPICCFIYSHPQIVSCKAYKSGSNRY